MYDLSGTDTGREWVEIYNNGSSSVDITGWKFQESPSASNHVLTQIQGVSVIPAGGFAVIAVDPTKFLLDWPTFSSNLFKASFSSLNNTGSTIVLKDNTPAVPVVKDQVVYTSDQGASGDGNSLQKNGSTWIPAAPTPGTANSAVAVTPSAGDSNASTTPPVTDTTDTTPTTTSSSGSSAHSSPAPLSTINEKIEFEVSAGRSRLSTVGNTIMFRASVTKSENISERNTGYTWSFGDGMTAQGDIVNHAYRFGGDYTVVLNATNGDKLAVDRVAVKITEPIITLQRVEQGVELSNKSGSEINLEGWKLVSGVREFIFPKDTIVGGNKKIVFGDDVTHLNADTLSLVNPLGKEFAVLVPILPTSVVKDTKVSTTTTPIDVIAVATEIENLKLELADMSLPAQDNSDTSFVMVKPSTFPDPVAKSDEKVPDSITSATSSQLGNVVEIFKAPESQGLVSRMFAWPISGFNFIRHLFVEE